MFLENIQVKKYGSLLRCLRSIITAKLVINKLTTKMDKLKASG